MATSGQTAIGAGGDHHASKKRKSGNTSSIMVGVSNACSECYRRKQKCDRKRPCGTCVARGVVPKCMFDEDFR
ncbi:hypothetical protein EDD37DRAFT_44439 [Exophiala viscosa]|uniref:uncharacterized protein n=1 Tax=Exophiala viscosa TaxID=2486360 RepID=UPI002192F7BD|nr:hypothetical protein EDD37DRAFT_44439 [Exophiala viscosa]